MSPQFNRLLWKEYRAQRTLWIVLAGAALFVIFILGYFATETAHADFSLSNQILSLTMVLTVAFATASIALAFAAEQEEGTAIWIRQFPVSTPTLLSAKLLVTIAGSVGLFLFCVTASCLFLLLCGTSGQRAITQFFNADVLADPGCMLAGGLSFLAIATVCSLRSRKVFTALGWSGSWFVSYSILTSNSTHGPLSVLPLLTLLCFTLLTMTSARQWHRGLPTRETAHTPLSQISHFRFAQRTSTWFHKTSASKLIQWAQTPTLLSRTVKTLLWRELRFAVPFFMWCLGLGLIAVLLRCTYELTEVMLPLFACLGFVGIECGLRTFRHDQQQLHGLFWSHRGVSPALVWLTRNAVWLGTLIIICLTLTAVEELTLWLLDNVYAHGRRESLNRMPSVMTTCEALAQGVTAQTGSMAGPALSLQIAGVAISFTWVIGVFTVCQLCACWVRKPIVAMFMGLIAASAFTFWFGFLCIQDIPVWLTVGPFVLTLAVAGFVTRRQWMDRRMSLKIVAQRIAWIVIPAACMYPIQNLWRALQVPSTVVVGMNNAAFARFGYSEENVHGTVPDAWETFVLAAQPALSKHRDLTDVATQLQQAGQLSPALAAVDTILAADLSQTRLPPKYRVPWFRSPLATGCTNILLGQANLLRDRGQVEEAAIRAVDAVRLNQYLNREVTSWDQWGQAMAGHRSALRHLRTIVADDRLTEDQLVEIQDQFSAIELGVAGDFNIFTNRLVVYSQLLNREGYLWDQYETLSSINSSPQTQWWPNKLINSNIAERIRMLRLMQLLDRNQSVSSFTETSHQSGAIASDFNRAFSAKMQRWLHTSVWQETDVGMDLLQSQRHGQGTGDRLARDTLNSHKATEIMIALQRYRRRHACFPDALRELEEFGLDTHDRVDVNHGSEFGYAPEGLGASLPIVDASGQPQAIAATQPIIWSHGNAAPWHLQTLVHPNKHRVNPVQPGTVVYISGTHVFDSLYDGNFWKQSIIDLERTTAAGE